MSAVRNWLIFNLIILMICGLIDVILKDEVINNWAFGIWVLMFFTTPIIFLKIAEKESKKGEQE